MKLEFESNTSSLPFAVSNYPTAVKSENGAANVKQMLQAGIAAAQNGNRNEARHLLIQVTETEPQNETAWLWMASISEYPEELIIFLNNVLSINPQNVRAQDWMKATKSLLAKTFVQRGVEAVKTANKDFARQCFLQAVAHDNKNEDAWYALSELTDSSEEKISHLQKILNLNPDNSVAQQSLQTAKKQAAENVLQKANRAAISGDADAAKQMLQEVFKYAPELEEAWILKAYLADSFSEKITCFEKVLTLNPENEMANSGLASLRALMVKTESNKAEQGAIIAGFEAQKESSAANAVPNEIEESFAFSGTNFEQTDYEENSPTEELEFPPDFLPAELYSENLAASSMSSISDTIGFSVFGENDASTSEFDSAENHTDQNLTTGNLEASAIAETSLSEQNHKPYAQNFSDAPEADFTSEDSTKVIVEMTICPFCNAENDANVFVCGSCRTILSLSDLEMMLANNEFDQETLRMAVDRMEDEKNVRPFSANELKNLAIGQINLKNIRQGIVHLQKAAQMNPNDVMLSSQVNLLKIRLSEIEQQESVSKQQVRGRKILVVDDSATVRKLISSKLEKSGHEVYSAVDGIDALEKIKEFIPDLVLLDIMMPQLDGYQVCKLIRTNESTKNVPIVMISGKDGFFDKVRGRMAGTTGYITKPFGPETLMRTVESYILHKNEEPFVNEIEAV